MSSNTVDACTLGMAVILLYSGCCLEQAGAVDGSAPDSGASDGGRQDSGIPDGSGPDSGLRGVCTPPMGSGYTDEQTFCEGLWGCCSFNPGCGSVRAACDQICTACSPVDGVAIRAINWCYPSKCSPKEPVIECILDGGASLSLSCQSALDNVVLAILDAGWNP